jgi:hypothetical protein
MQAMISSIQNDGGIIVNIVCSKNVSRWYNRQYTDVAPFYHQVMDEVSLKQAPFETWDCEKYSIEGIPCSCLQWRPGPSL